MQDFHDHQRGTIEHVPDTMYVIPLIDERMVHFFERAVQKFADEKGLGEEIRTKLNRIKSRLSYISDLAVMARFGILGQQNAFTQFREEIKCLVHTPTNGGSHHEHDRTEFDPDEHHHHSEHVKGINFTALIDLFAGITFTLADNSVMLKEYLIAITDEVEKAITYPYYFFNETSAYLNEGKVPSATANLALGNIVERLLSNDPECAKLSHPNIRSRLEDMANTWVKSNPVTSLMAVFNKELNPINHFDPESSTVGKDLKISLKAKVDLNKENLIVLFTPHVPAEIISVQKDEIHVKIPRYAESGPVLVLSKKSFNSYQEVESALSSLSHHYPFEWEKSLFTSIPFNKWAYPLAFDKQPQIEIIPTPHGASVALFDKKGRQVQGTKVIVNEELTVKYEVYPYGSDSKEALDIEIAGDITIRQTKRNEIKILPKKVGRGSIKLKWKDFEIPIDFDILPIPVFPPEIIEQPNGVWDEPLLNALAIVGVHAVVLHTGKVLYFSFDYRCVNNPENVKKYFADPNLGSYQVWDPATNTATPVRPVGRNVFCAGQCQLADGTIFVAGGQDGAGAAELTGEWDKYFAAGGVFTFFIPGLDVNNGASKDIHTYDPVNDIWERWPDMKDNRYYPTCQILDDGSAMVVAGLSNLQRFIASGGNWNQNDQYEIYGNRNLGLGPIKSGKFMSADQYPIIKLMPGSKHVFTHIHNTTYLFDLSTGRMIRDAEFIPPIPVGRWTYPMQTGHALLPQFEGETSKLFVVGGSTHSNFDYNTQSDAPPVHGAYIFEYNSTAPIESRWRLTRGNPTIGRLLTDTVLLPDGTVFIVNGISGGASSGHNQPPVFQCEIFDPVTELFTEMAPPDLNHPRAYHSTAVLLPDARVAIAGHTAAYNQPASPDDCSIQIFNPPYLFLGPRPQVVEVPTIADYGENIEIEYSNSPTVRKLMMMRPCAATHTVDMDQRAIWLTIVSRASVEDNRYILSFSFPTDRSLAPPGYYMLFFISDRGVPSIASWVLLGREGRKDPSPPAEEPGHVYPTVYLGKYEHGANVSSVYDGNIVVEKIDQHCNVTLESRYGSITINEKCDQHCTVRLTAKTTISIGQKIDQHCNVTIRCEGDITIGQKIDGNSSASINTINGSLTIGEKIDGNSSVTVRSTNGSVFIGQKIDGHSVASFIVPNGTITIVQKVGGGSDVTWLGTSFNCPEVGGATINRYS